MDKNKEIKEEKLKDANGGYYFLSQTNSVAYSNAAFTSQTNGVPTSNSQLYTGVYSNEILQQDALTEGNTLENCCQFANGSRLPNVPGCITNDQIVTNGTVTTNGAKLRNTFKNNIIKDWIK